jgi:hypothetical protein
MSCARHSPLQPPRICLPGQLRHVWRQPHRQPSKVSARMGLAGLLVALVAAAVAQLTIAAGFPVIPVPTACDAACGGLSSGTLVPACATCLADSHGAISKWAFGKASGPLKRLPLMEAGLTQTVSDKAHHHRPRRK